MIIIILNYSFSCTETFLQQFKQHIQEVIPAVQSGIPFTVKQLCSKSYWSKLSDGQRRLAGMCMTYLVATGQLPFDEAPSIRKNPYPVELHARLIHFSGVFAFKH